MRTRLSDLTESLLRQRSDLEYLGPAGDNPEDGLEFAGGPGHFDDECIYDAVDDRTALWLLNDWIDDATNLGFDVHCELSKLLSKRGRLVHDRVEPIIRRLAALKEGEGGFTPWSQYQLLLSYLCQMPDGEALAIHFLYHVPEDFRDGLLLACYKMNTPAIYEAVKAAVRRWYAGFWCAGSTGESSLIHQMVQQWDQTFPGSDHEDIRRIAVQKSAG
jgi:hypothetical protein